MHASDESRHALGKALGRIPSGVFIITAAHGAQRAALLGSWVQQASFQPPALIIALAKGRPIRPLLEAAGAFAVSVVGRDDRALMKKFARPAAAGQDPFAGVATAATPLGAIYLTDAVAWLECRFRQAVDFDADHELIVAEVLAGAMLHDAAPFVHVRGSGFHY